LKLTDKDFERNYSSVDILQDLKKYINIDDFSEKVKSIETFVQKSGPSG
jgi:hypothetical protein